MSTTWKEEYDKVLTRIQNNDETFTHLKLVFDPTPKWPDELSYTAVIKLLRENPDTLRKALEENTCITSIYVQIAPKGESADPESPTYDFGMDWGKPNSLLSKTIGSMTSLESLTINGAQTFRNDHERDIVVAYFLGNVRQIKMCSLQIQNCNHKSALFFDQALKGHPSLESVNYQVLCNDETQQEEYFPFSTCLPTLRRLQSLSVGCDEPLGKELKLLGFAACDNTTSSFGDIDAAATWSTLRRVTIQDCGLDEEGIAGLIATLEVNPTLQVLDVCCPADAQFFVRLVKSAQALSKLQISAWSPDNYRKGNTPETAIYTMGLTYLASNLSLSKKLTHFSAVEFSWTETQLGLLQSFLGNTSTLESLSLQFGPESVITDETWLALARSVSQSTLKELNVNLWGFRALSNDGLNEGHAELVASQTLTTYSIRIDGSKYYYLIELIERSNFQTLNCDGAWFTVDFGKKLAERLKSNYSLSELNIKYGKVPSSEEQEEAIAIEKMIKIVLKLNEQGRHYMKHNKTSKKKGVALLSAVASQRIPHEHIDVNSTSNELVTDDLRLDCLYFHLSENPSLCDQEPTQAKGSRFMLKSLNVRKFLPNSILPAEEPVEKEDEKYDQSLSDSMRLLQKTPNTRHLDVDLPPETYKLDPLDKGEQNPESTADISSEEEELFPDSAAEI